MSRKRPIIGRPRRGDPAGRLRRSRRPHVRVPEAGPRHRCGPAVDGQDGHLPQHLPARRAEDGHVRRLLLHGDVQGIAGHAHALLPGEGEHEGKTAIGMINGQSFYIVF